MKAAVFDDRACWLGEGPLWHPRRNELFWFDIHNHQLLSQTGAVWSFPVSVSAAAWVDEQRLMVASEVGLHLFDIDTGRHEPICDLEADNPVTRSNDGRADPYGGFWIGTMGKDHEPKAGSYWRYYRGELKRLYAGIGVPNAICFTPDGGSAFITDTMTHCKIMRVPLDSDGWPRGEPEVYLDLGSEGLLPDGAVIDVEGNFWNAQYKAGRVAGYDPDGRLFAVVEVDAPQATCPAFGGPDLTTLYCTSATQTMTKDALAASPDSGKTFYLEGVAKGQEEHQVIL